MSDMFKGRVAVITGAGGGIGLAILLAGILFRVLWSKIRERYNK